MIGGEPALLTQRVDVCLALASMMQNISFSLALGSTFSFNLDTRKKATSPENVREDSKETSLSVSPVRDTNREEKVIEEEEEEEAPTFPEEVIFQRQFSRLNEHLESDLNKDLVKNFKSCEKEKIPKKMPSYDVIITVLKGLRVQRPKHEHNYDQVMM